MLSTIKKVQELGRLLIFCLIFWLDLLNFPA